MLANSLHSLLTYLVTNPAILREKDAQANAELYKHATVSIGSWSPYEAVFAKVLRQYGIPPKPMYWGGVNGMYYIHNPETHSFQVVCMQDSVVVESVKIEVKWSNTNTLLLNETWFDDNTLYIFSWNHVKHVPKCFVGFGSTFTTLAEQSMMKEWLYKKKEMNRNAKAVGRIQIVLSLNTVYKLTDFTDEYNASCLQQSLEKLERLDEFPRPPSPKNKRLKVRKGNGVPLTA